MPVRTLELPVGGLDDHDSVAIDEKHSPDLRNVRSLRDRIVVAPGGTLLAPAPLLDVGLGVQEPGVVLGTFVQRTGTGTQVVPHSLGITPQALILFGGAATLDALDSGFGICMGIYDGTTQRSASSRALDIVQTPSQIDFSHAARRYANAIFNMVLPHLSPTGPTTGAQASATAWDATTFTLNWTTNDDIARTISFIAIGLTSGLSAKVKEWTPSASAGNQAVTGVGFLPDVVLHLSNFVDSLTGGPASNGNLGGARFMLGVMDASAQWCVTETLPTGGIYNASWTATDSCLNRVENDTGTISIEQKARYVSMDADGFTITKSTAPGGHFPVPLVASLCLAGLPSHKIGVLASPLTSDPPVHMSTTGVGFKPQFVLAAGVGTPIDNAPHGGVGFGLGASDGTRQYVSAVAQRNAHAPKVRSYTSTMQMQAQIDLVSPGKVSNPAPLDLLGSLYAMDADGFTINYTQRTGDANPNGVYLALLANTSSPDAQIGVIRNYGDLIVGGAVPTEKVLMLTSKSAFVYTPSTPSTGIFTPTAEVYTGTDVQRFSIVSTTDAAGAFAAWSQGKDNIRRWDGTTFSALVTVGTNHAARTLIAFNNRVLSIRPLIAGVDQKTQLRWSVNGNASNWSGTGSGVLEVVETSNAPLTGGFVLADRAYITRQRELIELIATGSLTPVFRTETRVSGIGCLATHSIAVGDVYAFFLGSDEVYMWDGAQLRAVGGRAYNTITALVDYTNLDQIQGTVYTPDSQYWLAVPPYIFVYDYRRDIWDWDDTRSFQAIGRLEVADVFTADIDHSELVVIGDSAVQTIRADPSVATYLGASIDAYFWTKDFTPQTLQRNGQYGIAYDKYNSVWRFWFRATPGAFIEVCASIDKGTSVAGLQTVEVNAGGVGIAFFDIAFGIVRFRLRSVDASPQAYSVQGPLQYDFTETGVMLPP